MSILIDATHMFFYIHNTIIIDQLNIYVNTFGRQLERLDMSWMVNHCASQFIVVSLWCVCLLPLGNYTKPCETQAWDIPTTLLIQLMQRLSPWCKRCLLPGMTLWGCWLCNLATHNNSMAKALFMHTYLLYADIVDTSFPVSVDFSFDFCFFIFTHRTAYFFFRFLGPKLGAYFFLSVKRKDGTAPVHTCHI